LFSGQLRKKCGKLSALPGLIVQALLAQIERHHVKVPAEKKNY